MKLITMIARVALVSSCCLFFSGSALISAQDSTTGANADVASVNQAKLSANELPAEYSSAAVKKSQARAKKGVVYLPLVSVSSYLPVAAQLLLMILVISLSGIFGAWLMFRTLAKKILSLQEHSGRSYAAGTSSASSDAALPAWITNAGQNESAVARSRVVRSGISPDFRSSVDDNLVKKLVQQGTLCESFLAERADDSFKIIRLQYYVRNHVELLGHYLSQLILDSTQQELLHTELVALKHFMRESDPAAVGYITNAAREWLSIWEARQVTDSSAGFTNALSLLLLELDAETSGIGMVQRDQRNLLSSIPDTLLIRCSEDGLGVRLAGCLLTLLPPGRSSMILNEVKPEFAEKLLATFAKEYSGYTLETAHQVLDYLSAQIGVRSSRLIFGNLSQFLQKFFEQLSRRQQETLVRGFSKNSNGMELMKALIPEVKSDESQRKRRTLFLNEKQPEEKKIVPDQTATVTRSSHKKAQNKHNPAPQPGEYFGTPTTKKDRLVLKSAGKSKPVSSKPVEGGSDAKSKRMPQKFLINDWFPLDR